LNAFLASVQDEAQRPSCVGKGVTINAATSFSLFLMMMCGGGGGEEEEEAHQHGEGCADGVGIWRVVASEAVAERPRRRPKTLGLQTIA